MVFKSINQRTPVYLASIFQRSSEISARQPRNSDSDLDAPLSLWERLKIISCLIVACENAFKS